MFINASWTDYWTLGVWQQNNISFCYVHKSIQFNHWKYIVCMTFEIFHHFKQTFETPNILIENIECSRTMNIGIGCGGLRIRNSQPQYYSQYFIPSGDRDWNFKSLMQWKSVNSIFNTSFSDKPFDWRIFKASPNQSNHSFSGSWICMQDFCNQQAELGSSKRSFAPLRRCKIAYGVQKPAKNCADVRILLKL